MENRSNNCQNGQNTKTSYQTTNNKTQNSTATNEHKHPNQYTKGADDESAKNSVKNSAR